MAEKEYIEREEILQKLSRMIKYCEKDNNVNGLTALFQVGDAVINCKSANVEEVVYCKNCQYFDEAKVNEKGFLICPVSGMEIAECDFCSYGKKE